MFDPILFWNHVALEANRVSHSNGRGEQTGPVLSARALALVHLAMYDAYVALQPAPRPPLYLTGLPAAPAPGTADDAVAGAAYGMLTQLFPSQAATFEAARRSVAGSDNDSYTFGVGVAAALFRLRAADPDAGSCNYRPRDQPGKHRPDPDNLGQGFHAPHYGARCAPFAVTAHHRLAPPPFRTGGGFDATYLRALAEVRGLGIKPELTATLPAGHPTRTADQTLAGIYWGYDGAVNLGTPPRLYNQILRQVALERGNNPLQNAQLFALANVAMADGGISAWHEKYRHNLWRPVLGIREHDAAMGPMGAGAAASVSPDCDPHWLPLGAPNTNHTGKNFTPPFPAYPSGHATFGAAALHMARLFYGQGGRFSNQSLADDELLSEPFVSDEFNGNSFDNAGTARPRHRRTFPGGLRQMIEENGRSRVYLGVHWIFDAFHQEPDGTPDYYFTKDEDGLPSPIGGVPLGLVVAEDIFDRFSGFADQGRDGWRSTLEAAEPHAGPAASSDGTATFSSSYHPSAQAR